MNYDFIKEETSKSCFPEEYGEECFSNLWFFDDSDKLFSIAGKSA